MGKLGDGLGLRPGRSKREGRERERESEENQRSAWKKCLREIGNKWMRGIKIGKSHIWLI